jgi:Fe-S-cluster containining protein
MTKRKKGDNAKVNLATKCFHCPGTRCCQYITQQIEAPRSKADFDHLLWQVSHENVEVYKDEDGWYLMFISPCSKLIPDGRCGIYDQRPQICRDYSNDYCEFDAPAEEGFLLHFRDHESLDRYCRKRFKRWDERFR